jgi:hypothetical protein
VHTLGDAHHVLLASSYATDPYVSDIETGSLSARFARVPRGPPSTPNHHDLSRKEASRREPWIPM